MEMLARALLRCLVYLDRVTICTEGFPDDEDDSTLFQGAWDALGEARYLIGQASPPERESVLRVIRELRAEEVQTRAQREVLHFYATLLREDFGLEPDESEEEPEDD
jgi:hypothetical protein